MRLKPQHIIVASVMVLFAVMASGLSKGAKAEVPPPGWTQEDCKAHGPILMEVAQAKRAGVAWPAVEEHVREEHIGDQSTPQDTEYIVREVKRFYDEPTYATAQSVMEDCGKSPKGEGL